MNTVTLSQTNQADVKLGRFAISLEERKIFIAGHTLELTEAQFNIVRTLAEEKIQEIPGYLSHKIKTWAETVAMEE